MSNVNEFNASTSSATLRTYTTEEQAIVTAAANAARVIETTPIATSATYVGVTGSAYTIEAEDLNKIVEVNHATGTTVTIPSDPSDSTFPIGWSAEFRQIGDGRITFTATSPATLASAEDYVKTRVKYSSAVVEKRANNAWILVGDIDA